MIFSSSFTPLVVPSALENFQTALRDPAFYILWKRILTLYNTWQKRMPLYKPEELKSKGVEIEKVEVDKLTTFFDKNTFTYYPNIFKSKPLIILLTYRVSYLYRKNPSNELMSTWSIKSIFTIFPLDRDLGSTLTQPNSKISFYFSGRRRRFNQIPPSQPQAVHLHREREE